MKQIFSGFIVLASFALSVQAFSQKPLTAYKRILFLGNSVTYDGKYVANIESYLRLKYPDAKVEIINMGLPSETVSGLSEPGHADNRFARPDLHERLARVLPLVKPDLVFASYGINDGIYLPLEESRFAKYREGIGWLHREITKTGAAIIHFTAPYYDELRAGNKGYGNTMDKYAEWLLTTTTDSGWTVIDIYHPMKKYLQAHRKLDADFHLDGFDLAADGVHPNANAHWLIARSILVAMGEKDAAEVVSIDAYATGYRNGKKIVEIINAKHLMMKDAWLTAAGHKRPEMNKGLPLLEAKNKERQMEDELQTLNLQR